MNTITTFVSKIASLRDDRRGVTALEYGLIASLVAIAIIGAVTTLGGNLSNEFTYIAGKV
jgi:pilus assembly protein Flp/PilA